MSDRRSYSRDANGRFAAIDEAEAMALWNSAEHNDWNHELIDFDMFARNPRPLSGDDADKILELESARGSEAAKQEASKLYATPVKKSHSAFGVAHVPLGRR